MFYEEYDFTIEVLNNLNLDKNSQRAVHMLKFVRLNEASDPFIMHHFDMASTEYAYIVLPYYQNESLLYFYMLANKQGHKISQKLKNYFCKQVMLCVLYMHLQGYSHCDIKPDNFIIDNDY